jgi:hypothetical protein
MRDGSATAHLYHPKLATVLAEGYNFSSFLPGHDRGTHGCDRGGSAVDGDCRCLGRFAPAGIMGRRHAACPRRATHRIAAAPADQRQHFNANLLERRACCPSTGIELPLAVFGLMFGNEIVKDLTLFFVGRFRQSFVE